MATTCNFLLLVEEPRRLNQLLDLWKLLELPIQNGLMDQIFYVIKS